ncbi:MAG: (2Fe-2S)-binding protein, partial [Myxococcaceae bacterium]|nr:(2Fe-2S)-binding protein [Myxococcaceae bacterium]
MSGTFTLDGRPIPFTDGETVLQAAERAGVYVPHLCTRPDLPFEPHGSCRVCIVKAGGREVTSCTLPASEGLTLESETEEVNALRRQLVQLLFVEGNHFCPSCEQNDDC